MRWKFQFIIFLEEIFIWGRLTVYEHDILKLYEIYIIFLKIQILNMTLYLYMEKPISQENFIWEI